MSVVDPVRLGNVIFKPSAFEGTTVKVVVSFDTDPAENGDEPLTDVPTKPLEGDGQGGFVLPIKAWESLQRVQGQVTAYEAAFQRGEAHDRPPAGRAGDTG